MLTILIYMLNLKIHYKKDNDFNDKIYFYLIIWQILSKNHVKSIGNLEYHI